MHHCFSRRKRIILPDVLSGTIHGILRVPLHCDITGVDCHRVVVYGGREFVQLLFVNDEWRRPASGRPTRLSDWISTAYLFAGSTSCAGAANAVVTNRLVVVTSHGVALSLQLQLPTSMAAILDGRPMESSARVVQTAKCPAKETLYCARIAVDQRLVRMDTSNHWRGLTFLGGTAFGELIVWDCGAVGGLPRIVQRTTCHNVSGLGGLWFLQTHCE